MNSHYRHQMVEDEDQEWLKEMLRLAHSPEKVQKKLSHDERVILAFMNGENLDTLEDNEHLKFSHDEQVIRYFMSGSGVFAQD